jgi:hypothetical protein
MWTRNGNSVAGMVINYSTAPLCRAFRDLDLSLMQFSAAGFEIGIGVRRVLALLLNHFSMDGYFKDPKFQAPGATHSRRTTGHWKSPPRLQDPEHAPLLAESFFELVWQTSNELQLLYYFHSDQAEKMRHQLESYIVIIYIYIVACLLGKRMNASIVMSSQILIFNSTSILLIFRYSDYFNRFLKLRKICIYMHYLLINRKSQHKAKVKSASLHHEAAGMHTYASLWTALLVKSPSVCREPLGQIHPFQQYFLDNF